MSKSKSNWQCKTLKLKEGHGWTSKPGYNIFALGRGDIRFEYPRYWQIKPADDNSHIQIFDKTPPDDDCTLGVSCGYLNDAYDWSGLPLGKLVEDECKHDTRNPYFWGDLVEFQRHRAKAAWKEVRFIDPNEKREAHSRLCRAMWSNVLALITFDYWEVDAPKMTPVWDVVMETMVLADYIEDPTRRVVD